MIFKRGLFVWGLFELVIFYLLYNCWAKSPDNFVVTGILLCIAILHISDSFKIIRKATDKINKDK